MILLISSQDDEHGLPALRADEQAALRRVATLVARDVPPEELLAAVAGEVGGLLGADLAGMIRNEPDDTVTPVATWAADGEHPPVPDRWATEEGDPTTMVANTRRPARVDDWTGVRGPIAAFIRDELHVRSSVGSPILVEGRLWGALAVHSRQSGPLPADTEARLRNFTELVGTAMSNVQTRAEMQRLMDEQAALRRVATLVARESPPAAIFAAVAEEVGRLLDVEAIRIVRYEDGGAVQVVASWGEPDAAVPVGTPLTPGDHGLTSTVRQTGRPARVDDLACATATSPSPCVSWASARPSGPRSSSRDGSGGSWSPPRRARSRCRPARRSGSGSSRSSWPPQSPTSRRAPTSPPLARASWQRPTTSAGGWCATCTTEPSSGLSTRSSRSRPRTGRSSAGDGDAVELVGEALGQAEHAIDELHELAHGILPSALAHGGLRAGVKALAGRMPLPIEVGVSVGRLPRPIEASAYFVVAEALTNVAKHSRAGHAAVTAHIEDGTLQVRVRDDGVGGARADGSGLLGLADRLAVLDGRLDVENLADGGTLVAAAIPLAA